MAATQFALADDLTMERAELVQSAALRRVLVEQIQYRGDPAGTGGSSYWDTHKNGNHTNHNNCLCVLGGV